MEPHTTAHHHRNNSKMPLRLVDVLGSEIEGLPYAPDETMGEYLRTVIAPALGVAAVVCEPFPFNATQHNHHLHDIIVTLIAMLAHI